MPFLVSIETWASLVMLSLQKIAIELQQSIKLAHSCATKIFKQSQHFHVYYEITIDKANV